MLACQQMQNKPPMNNITNYFEFFKGIADNNKDIKYFTRISMNVEPGESVYYLQEFLNSLSEMQTPMLVSEAYVSKIEDNYSDNKLFDDRGAFFILVKGERSDFDKNLIAYQQAEDIAIQVMAYLKEYFKKPNNIIDYDYQFRDITIDRIGPIGDSLFGARVDFKYYNNAQLKLKVDPSKWQTLP